MKTSYLLLLLLVLTNLAESPPPKRALLCTINQGVLNSSGQCICFAGYSGSSCGFQTSKCDSVCGNGICVPTNTNVIGYICNCMPGYTGTNCETQYNPCYNGGTPTLGVVNSPLGFTCKCPIEFSGPTCSYLNLCLNYNQCQNNGTCLQMGEAIVNCNCNPRFTGPFCEVDTCIDRDIIACQNMLPYCANGFLQSNSQVLKVNDFCAKTCQNTICVKG